MHDPFGAVSTRRRLCNPLGEQNLGDANVSDVLLNILMFAALAALSAAPAELIFAGIAWFRARASRWFCVFLALSATSTWLVFLGYRLYGVPETPSAETATGEFASLQSLQNAVVIAHSMILPAVVIVVFGVLSLALSCLIGFGVLASERGEPDGT